MELVFRRINKMHKALDRLDESIQLMHSKKYPELYTELRDSVIKRFEICADQIWKVIKIYVEQVNQSDIEGANPRGVFNTARNANIITEKEFADLLTMIKDRNQTSHIYEEDAIEVIAAKVPGYYILMRAVINRLKDSLAQLT